MSKSRVSLCRVSGFTLVEIMTVLGIMAIIVAISAPSIIGSRTRSQSKACQEAQSKLAGAIQEWAIEKNAQTAPSYADLVGPDKYLMVTPACPVNNKPIALPASVDGDIICPEGLSSHSR